MGQGWFGVREVGAEVGSAGLLAGGGGGYQDARQGEEVGVLAGLNGRSLGAVVAELVRGFGEAFGVADDAGVGPQEGLELGAG